ncbi:hypothetical protein GCM10027347_52540 [Larkinella harenae]
MPTARKSLSTCFVEPLLKLNESVLYHLMAEVVTENEDYIKKLNQDRLFQGKNTDGSEIRPGYKESTKGIKRKKNQPDDRVTLRDKGDVYERIFVDVFYAAFTVENSDPKIESLRTKYGDEILGMSKEDVERLAQHIKPLYIAKIKHYIGL